MRNVTDNKIGFAFFKKKQKTSLKIEVLNIFVRPLTTTISKLIQFYEITINKQFTYENKRK